VIGLERKCRGLIIALLENGEIIHEKLLRLLGIWLIRRRFMEYWR
jgi:hypothetical protein